MPVRDRNKEIKVTGPSLQWTSIERIKSSKKRLKKKTLQSGRKTDIFDDRIDIQIFKKQKKKWDRIDNVKLCIAVQEIQCSDSDKGMEIKRKRSGHVISEGHVIYNKANAILHCINKSIMYR